MRLALADGSSFEGEAFGAERAVRGEVVFHTGLVGYVETLTDPSYRGQILVLTYPLQGNYGVPVDGWESGRIQVAGLVVTRHARTPSHHRAVRSLADWLMAEGVPGLAGVDTRAITRRLRAQGTMDGTLGPPGATTFAGDDLREVVRLVAPTTIVRHEGRGPRVLVIDTGGKDSIVTSLVERGASVVRAPCFAPWEELLGEVDGVVLTNGPGDPMDLWPLAERLRAMLARELPVLGICLGHQLLALAAGARTYKLPFGHRSHNQPVLEVGTQRAFVTSQNHGYAVDGASLPADWAPWFTNVNDGSNEGIRHRTGPWRSVQFHPEAAPGPRDAGYLFDEFLAMARERATRAG
jgi:carbamoyl-phosphate synthase small subunit